MIIDLISKTSLKQSKKSRTRQSSRLCPIVQRTSTRQRNQRRLYTVKQKALDLSNLQITNPYNMLQEVKTNRINSIQTIKFSDYL